MQLPAHAACVLSRGHLPCAYIQPRSSPALRRPPRGRCGRHFPRLPCGCCCSTGAGVAAHATSTARVTATAIPSAHQHRRCRMPVRRCAGNTPRVRAGRALPERAGVAGMQRRLGEGGGGHGGGRGAAGWTVGRVGACVGAVWLGRVRVGRGNAGADGRIGRWALCAGPPTTLPATHPPSMHMGRGKAKKSCFHPGAGCFQATGHRLCVGADFAAGADLVAAALPRRPHQAVVPRNFADVSDRPFPGPGTGRGVALCRWGAHTARGRRPVRALVVLARHLPEGA